MRTSADPVVRTYVADASHRGLTDDVLDALVAPWTGDDGHPAFYRQIAEYDERYLVEIEQQLGELRIPVRIVWGTEDTWIPVERAEKLLTLIPGASLGRIPAAGHLVHHDAPAALMDEVRAWLDARR